MTAFLYALITQKAFLILYLGGVALHEVLNEMSSNIFIHKYNDHNNIYNELPIFHNISYDSNFIKCHLKNNEPDDIKSITKIRNECIQKFPLIQNSNLYTAINLFNNVNIDRFIYQTNFLNNKNNITYFLTNRARSVDIFKNPYHNNTLRKYGIIINIFSIKYILLLYIY